MGRSSFLFCPEVKRDGLCGIMEKNLPPGGPDNGDEILFICPGRIFIQQKTVNQALFPSSLIRKN